MNTDRPVVLIHSGDEETDAFLRDGLQEAFPNVGLRTVSDEAEVRHHLQEAEVVMAWGFPFELLSCAPKLRWLQLLGAGADSLSGVSLPVGTTVTNIRDVFGTSMAEHAIAYMLAHAKRLRRFSRLQERREWKPGEPALLCGRTVGVAGLGSIGRTVAAYCSALGMEVIGFRRRKGTVPGVAEVYTTDQIEEFLHRCDYLVLVMPATRETAGLLTAERLQHAKVGCFLVNIGRGNVVSEEDLVDALESGRLAGAALDVFAQEPLPASSPLWGMENVYITPHISGINRAKDLLPPVRENLKRYLRGEALSNRVDLQQGY